MLQIAETFGYDEADFEETGFRAFIVSSSGRGKSYLCGVLCEEALDSGLPVIVIDPDGEYWTLKERYPTLVVGGEHADLPLSRRTRVIRELLSLALSRTGFALVFDLSELRERDQQAFFADAAEELFVLKQREARGTCLLVVEEAQIFAPQRYGGRSNDVAEEISRRGRKRGLWLAWVTQRSADISKTVISQCPVVLVGGMEHDLDFQAVRRRLPKELSLRDFVDLPVGSFFASPPGEVIQVRKRRVTHGGETPGVGRPVTLASEVEDASLAVAIERLLEIQRAEDEREEEEAGELAELKRRSAELEQEVAQLRQGESIKDLLRQSLQDDAPVDAGTVAAALSDELEGSQARIAELEAQRDEALGQAHELRGLLESARRDGEALEHLRRGFVALGVGEGPISAAPAPSVEAVVAEVLARLPDGRQAIAAPPLEVLRAQFLQEEVDRLLQDVRGLDPRPRRYLLWLIQNQGHTSMQSLVRHVTGDTVRGGSKHVQAGKDLKPLGELGLAENVERQGWHATVEVRIRKDLVDYEVSEEDVTRVRDQVVAILATDPKALP